MYTQIGSCPRCGAPRWSPSLWMAVTPPPSTPSCACFPAAQTVTSAGTGGLVEPHQVPAFRVVDPTQGP